MSENMIKYQKDNQETRMQLGKSHKYDIIVLT
jgi:hypothetical protein